MRSVIQKMILALWKAPSSRRSIIACCATEMFVRFVMLILNDITYLLDEGRESILKIQKIEKRICNGQLDTDNELPNCKRTAFSCISLGVGTITLLDQLSQSIVLTFHRPELLNRTACMLNWCNPSQIYVT